MGALLTRYAAALAVLLAGVAGARPAEAGTAPEIGAAAAVMVDRADGRVLFAKNAHERRAIASTTKIMTGLLIVERARPEEEVTVSREAGSIGESDPQISEVDLMAGERRTVGELIHALLIESANDAAVALAEHVAGSVPAFVELMNRRAVEIGAQDTRFENPHGLDSPGHYSSAADLALMARVALDQPLFARTVATTHFEFPGYRERAPRIITNRNTMLGVYPGADGVKTGRTRAAGRSLVASATRGTERRLAVVLASPAPEPEAALLLDHGFEGFERRRVVEPGRALWYLTYADGSTVALVGSREVSVLVPAGGSSPAIERRGSEAVVVLSVNEEIRVPLRRHCATGACPSLSSGKTNLMTALWGLLAPIARRLASLRP